MLISDTHLNSSQKWIFFYIAAYGSRLVNVNNNCLINLVRIDNAGFLQAACHFCHLVNSMKALKASLGL